MSRKAIGYLVPEFPGQTHNFFWREIAHLKKMGIEVELISTRRPVPELMATSWGELASRSTAYLHPLNLRDAPHIASYLVRGLARNLHGVLRLLRRAAVHGTRHVFRTLLLIPYGAKLAYLCRAKSLSHVHVHSCADALTMALIARLLDGTRYGLTLHNPLWVYGPGQETKWENAAYAIVITGALKTAVVQELGHAIPKRLSVAPMGVDCEIFKRTTPFEPYDSAAEFRIVSCARLNPAKGHLELISAVGKMRDAGLDATLTIAGEDDAGGRGFRKDMQSHIERLGLRNHVELMGAVSEEAVIRLLERAHVFALASHEEPLGVAIMEAMSMEIPVVVARSPGVCELVEDGIHGILFEPRDIDALAGACLHISRTPAYAKACGQRGRARVAEFFSSERSAKLIKTALEEDEAEVDNTARAVSASL